MQSIIHHQFGEPVDVLELGRTCKIIVPADTAVAPLKKEAFF